METDINRLKVVLAEKKGPINGYVVIGCNPLNRFEVLYK